MEQWKPIEGTDGKVEVSNYGRVKSHMRDERILKTCPDRKGYHRLRVTINRKKMSFKLHREVAKAFCPNPENKPQVNHIDGDKNNNRADNLEWVTNYENAHHAMDNNLWGNVFAASSRTCERLKTPIIATDVKTGEKRRFNSVSEAERFFNSRHISDVLKGKRSKAAGHTFVREGVIS